MSSSTMPNRRKSIVYEGDSLKDSFERIASAEATLIGSADEPLYVISSKLPLVMKWIPINRSLSKSNTPVPTSDGCSSDVAENTTVTIPCSNEYNLEVSSCTFRLCTYKKTAVQCFQGRVLNVGLVDSSVFEQLCTDWSTTKEIVKSIFLEKFACIPVFCTKEQLMGFHTFSKNVVWPIFHSLNVKESISCDPEWDCYCQIAENVTESLQPFLKENDYVWIHDYHFLVLPQKIKSLGKKVKIGFFLHIPFPTTEIFRMLPMRSELLSAVLDADLVAFQTFDYVRHFFRSCVRILGYDTTATEVDCKNGHVAKVQAIPIGVDIDYMNPSPPDSKFLTSIREKFKNQKVIFSRDTLEPIKGVPLKFKAFEKFLNHHPEWIGKVVLVQLITPPINKHCTFTPQFAQYQEPVERESITSPTTSTTSHHTRSKSASFQHRALPSATSSTAVFTQPSSPPSIKTSRNSLPKLTPLTPLMLVESMPSITAMTEEGLEPDDLQFTCYSKYFSFSPNNASQEKIIPDNQFSHSHILEKEYEVLESQVNDLAARINARFGDIHSQPVHCYFYHTTAEELQAFYTLADVALITPLRDGMNLTSFEYVLCQKEKKCPLILSEFCGSARSLSTALHVNPWYLEGVAKSISKALRMDDEEKAVKHQILYDFVHSHDAKLWGTQFLTELRQAAQYSNRPSTAPLDRDVLLKSYQSSKRRAIFLDYDGTLSPLVRHPSLAVPSARLLNILRKLTEEEANQISVLSGRDKESLDSWLSEIPNLNLFAEHGNFQKLRGSDNWEFAHPNIDISWHEIVIPILKYWEARTPGSFIEYKKVNIVWHYRLADLEYGELQAKEVKSQLDENIISRGLPVEILSGKKAIEVRPHGMHKGTAIRRMLSEQHYDFVLIIGDDVTDEDMFKTLDAISESKSEDNKSETEVADNKPTDSDVNAFTIVVGRHESRAKWFVESQPDVLNILDDITKCRPNRPIKDR